MGTVVVSMILYALSGFIIMGCFELAFMILKSILYPEIFDTTYGFLNFSFGGLEQFLAKIGVGDFYFLFINAITIIAVSLCCFLVVYSLLKCFNAIANGGRASTPITILMRFGVSVIFILNWEAIIRLLLNSIQSVLEKTQLLSKVMFNIDWSSWFNLDSLDIISTFLGLIISITLLIKVITVGASFIERYLSFVIYVYLAPIAAACLVSDETKDTFKLWFQGIFVEIGCILIAIIGLNIFARVFSTINSLSDIFLFLVCIASLTLCTNAEQFMRTLHFNPMPAGDTARSMLTGFGTLMAAANLSRSVKSMGAGIKNSKLATAIDNSKFGKFVNSGVSKVASSMKPSNVVNTLKGMDANNRLTGEKFLKQSPITGSTKTLGQIKASGAKEFNNENPALTVDGNKKMAQFAANNTSLQTRMINGVPQANKPRVSSNGSPKLTAQGNNYVPTSVDVDNKTVALKQKTLGNSLDDYTHSDVHLNEVDNRIKSSYLSAMNPNINNHFDKTGQINDPVVNKNVKELMNLQPNDDNFVPSNVVRDSAIAYGEKYGYAVDRNNMIDTKTVWYMQSNDAAESMNYTLSNAKIESNKQLNELETLNNRFAVFENSKSIPTQIRDVNGNVQVAELMAMQDLETNDMKYMFKLDNNLSHSINQTPVELSTSIDENNHKVIDHDGAIFSNYRGLGISPNAEVYYQDDNFSLVEANISDEDLLSDLRDTIFSTPNKPEGYKIYANDSSAKFLKEPETQAKPTLLPKYLYESQIEADVANDEIYFNSIAYPQTDPMTMATDRVEHKFITANDKSIEYILPKRNDNPKANRQDYKDAINEVKANKKSANESDNQDQWDTKHFDGWNWHE